MGNRKPPFEVRRLLGLQWLVRMLDGESRNHISRITGASRETVAKYVKEAVETLTDSAQAELIQRVLPKAAKLYEAALDRELARVEKGEAPNLELADRLMKGLYILQDPLGRKLVEDVVGKKALTEGEQVVETLAGFVATRKPALPEPKPTLKVIDAQVTPQADEGNLQDPHEEHRNGLAEVDNQVG